MIQWPRLGLYGEFEPCESGVIDALNSNFQIIDTLLQMSIIDFVETLPEDPNPGDIYILEDNPYTYSAGDSVIVMFNGNEWVYIVPQDGFLGYDQSSGQLIYYAFNQWNFIPSSFGDVSGPVSSINNEIARFDGVTGKWIKGSGVIIDDDKKLSGMSSIYVDNLVLNDDVISSDNGSVYVDSDLIVEDNLLVKGISQLLGKTEIQNQLEFNYENSALTGDNITLPARTKIITRLTHNGLNSINTITYSAQGVVILTNASATPKIITELGNIITGVDGELPLEESASIILYYDKVVSKYRVIGGTGSGSGSGGGVVELKPNDSTSSPSLVQGNPIEYWKYSDVSEFLWGRDVVPTSYKEGDTINLELGKVFTNWNTAGYKVAIAITTYLFKNGDDITSLSNASGFRQFVGTANITGANNIMMPINVPIVRNGVVKDDGLPGGNDVFVEPEDLLIFKVGILRALGDDDIVPVDINVVDKTFRINFKGE